MEAPRFEEHVRPLFREIDRTEMASLFDLWSYEDVKRNAAKILERVTEGTMPCDEPWDDEQIDLFDAWIASDYPQ